MGVAITELLVKKEISLEGLRGKTLIVDSSLWLYQFLSSIRQRDGSLLTDGKGNVTSHLAGLLPRIIQLIASDVSLCFVFDGEPPELKKKVLEERRMIKERALEQYNKAQEAGDEELMRRYSAMASRLTKEMIAEAKELVSAFGLPVINAPGEAEAQASLIVKNAQGYALSTNDADALLFGAPLIVRNLSLSGRKKKAGKLGTDAISPDIISLTENLNHLGIDHDQLIVLGMLIGTDYNPKGIKGIGPKNALKLIKKYGRNFDALFSSVDWQFPQSYKEVFDLFKNAKVTENYSLESKPIDKDKIFDLLAEKHNFSKDRLEQQLKPLEENIIGKAQKGLRDFFG